ncbi:DUF6531 domain-containing protein [Curtobacterium sp. BRD11]|uniref:DUF6531 domain-containing protein n=1 Tax=Curtobacterium sp. BRD11 TaxID=2962581 RepID=UPI002882A844|nr:DUF6531 domain-containing protein [Curtobacterium sp. BRD11]MDT0211659.1 DUF6531 domain-containing protein [Curtobacterium sp. BRD11]
MAQIHANMDPIEFDDATADALQSAMKSAAGAINGQRGSRRSYVSTASQEFRGRFAQLFSSNADVADSDADRIATALEKVAGWVGQMKEAAAKERDNRRRAREWQEREDERNGFQDLWNDTFHYDPMPDIKNDAPPTFEQPDVRARPRETPNPGSGGGGGGGTSSARPSDLRSFATGSVSLDSALEGRPAALRGKLTEFAAKCSWGDIDADSVVTAFEQWLGANAQDAKWATTIADAFTAAGGEGNVSTVADSALAAALAAAGVSETRQDLQFEPPSAYGAQPTTGFSMDPVNTSTGNFLEPELDLGFTGASASLEVTRMYNSLDEHVGIFGPGWSSILETRVLLDDEGATFVGADGRQIRFPRSGEGWDRGVGENRWLAAEGDLLVVRDNAGVRIDFTPSGLWTGQRGGVGTAVRVVRDADDLVVRLEHERGRWVEIEHVDGRVAVLRASDGRRVEYGYDDRGRLVSVTDPVGTRRYGWNDDDLVVTVTSAAGVVEVDNTYDDQRRVVEQVSPHGRAVRFAYLPGRVTVVSDHDGSRANSYIADAKGRLVGVIDSDDRRQSMSYDRHGNLVSATERDGSVTVHAYDDRGRKTRTVTPSGGDVTYGYDDQDRVTTVVTEAGAVVSYEYRGDDRDPSVIVDPVGGRTELTWTDGVLTHVVDPTGVVLDLAHDEFGELVATTNAVGDTAWIERDAAGRPVAAVSPSGARTEYRWDAAGLLVERRDADGAVWRYEHTAGGRVASITDPLGARTTFEYAASGELATTVDPLGRRVTRTFDDQGNVAALALPGDAVWTFAHDGLSRLQAVTDPTGATWRREYDVNGGLAATVDPTGVRQEVARDVATGVATLRDAFSATTVRFDEFGRPVEQTSDETGSELVTYDAAGRPVELVDGEGGLTRIERDLGGRVTAIVSPSGARSTYEYDACGRPSAAVDATGARTTLTYDADSRVVARTLPTGEVEETTYDAVGRVVAQTTAGSGTSRYRYDRAGRLVSSHDARFGQRRFRYDAAGQLVEAVDGLGGTTRFAYDERGRLIEVTDPAGGVTRPRYDGADRVVAVVDPLGRKTTARYDAAGRQVEQIAPEGRTTSWTFDAAGRSTKVLVDGQLVSETRRDAVDRTVVVTDHTRGAGRTVDHELEYDRRGLLVRRSRGGRSVRWEYDADGNRVARIDPTGRRTEWRCDALGRAVVVERQGLAAATFAYDAAGRIVQASTGDVVQSWSYERGALVAHTTTTPEGATVTRIEHDDQGRITAIDGADGRVEYAYDEAGQLVRSGGSEWEYGDGGRLLREVVDGVETTFEYDAAGQLVASVRGGERTEYLYDGLGRRVRRTNADGSTAEYAWSDLGSLTAVVSRDRSYGETGRFQMWTDVLGELAEVGGAEVWWDSAAPLPAMVSIGGESVLDLPGGAVALGDAWATAGWRSARSTDASDPWAVLASVEGTALPTGVSLTADGGLSIAGLEWLGARVYDPAARGFLSTDPLAPVLGAAWSGNPYSYAGNDPMHAIDPLGLRPATDEDLAAYRDANQSFLSRAANWVGDNWEYIAAGVAIVGGIALMATGIGGPAGIAAMALAGGLMSGGISVASQKATTGQVDWGTVGKDALIGTATGALGAGTGAALATKMGTGLAARAATGAASGMVEGGGTGALNYATSPGPHTVNGFVQATATQATIGALSGGSTAYRPKWLSRADASTFAGGLYRSTYVKEGTTMFRSGDVNGFHSGNFWSTDMPKSVSQVREDKALPYRWASSGQDSIQNAGFAAEFTKKMPAYKGLTAPQTGADGDYWRGGTNQTYVPGGYAATDVKGYWSLVP